MPTTLATPSAPVRWPLPPDLEAARDLLFSQTGPRLEEWLERGQARVIKQGPHQAVFRVILPEVDFYLKQYRMPDTRAWLRGLVRPSKARLEFDRIRAVAHNGVPTVEALAMGETGPESWLMTRTLADTVPMHDFLELEYPHLPSRRRTVLRLRLAVALGRLLARMHDAGVTHHDLHPGNVLLRLNDRDEPQLFLIDLYAARVGPPLTTVQRRANLIVLDRWFMLRSAPADRLRCLRAYQEASVQPLLYDPGELARATLRSNLTFWRQMDRRCVEKNRYFRRLNRPGLVGHAVTELDESALAALLADPDAPFDQDAATVLKRSRSGVVAEIDLPVGGVPRRLIYKRFEVTNWSDPLAALWRAPAALRSYQMGHGLRQRGLPTPRPLAVWYRVQHGLKREGYLLTEQVPDAVHLLEFLRTLGSRPSEEASSILRTLTEQAARLIRDLHRRGLSHRDLKALNLLVSTQPWSLSHAVRSRANPKVEAPPALSNSWQIWFIDLVGICRHERLPRRLRIQNLARLNASFHARPEVTRTDRLRFLRVYLGWRLRGKDDWKKWWRLIERATEVKISRNRRRGRLLG